MFRITKTKIVMLIKVACNKRGLLKRKIDTHVVSIVGDKVTVVESSIGVSPKEVIDNHADMRLLSFVDGIQSSKHWEEPRKSGRTTRIIDMAVQELFLRRSLDMVEFLKECDMVDNTAEISVFTKLVKRLKSEHNSQYRRMSIDTQKLTIQIS